MQINRVHSQLVRLTVIASLVPTLVGVAMLFALPALTHDTSADWRMAVALLGVGVVSAALFGWFSSRSAERADEPVRRVAEAADRIAQGSRRVQVDLQTSGAPGQLVRAFNQMARALDKADTRVRRMERLSTWRDIARQMAHEIKNPLTPIQMAVEMLRKARARNLDGFDELFEDETRIILEEVARLRRLVEDFSRFARAPKPRIAAMRVEDVVSHVVGLHVAGGDAEVTGEVDKNVPTVLADREQLTQVLVNLVGNACFAANERAQKHPHKGPAAVHVSAHKRDDGTIGIAVDDNGGGIDPAVMQNLFEPYVTTKQGKGGTGLGLAVAYKIVTDHNGVILVDTSPEGTHFEVVLPIQGPAEGAGGVTLSSLDSISYRAGVSSS